MRIISLAVLALLGVAFHATPFANAVMDQCRNCRMWSGTGDDTNGHPFRCWCRYFGGERITNGLHLNLRLSIDASGQFVWGAPGGHRERCDEFRLDSPGDRPTTPGDKVVYSANCLNAAGQVVRAVIDLNLHISKDNRGYLHTDD